MANAGQGNALAAQQPQQSRQIQTKLCLLGGLDKSKSSMPRRTAHILNSICTLLFSSGEAAVGKSSVVLRFVSNEFQENKEPTIGAAFLTQKCRLDSAIIKFEIWDTAGQERFHSLAPMYYRNAQASAVVYDITKAVRGDVLASHGAN